MHTVDWVIISVVMAALLAAAVWMIRKQRRRGQNCGGVCDSCPMPCGKAGTEKTEERDQD